MTSQTDDRSRWMALVVLCVGMLMIVLDATVVNVALPSIQEDLGFSQSSLAWVVNAYLIAFGGLLLLAGRLGDLISRRGVFLAGLGVFTVASLLCGAAQTQEMLIAARFVQGVGGAMASAVILGMIVTMFPEPREQAKAIGVYGFVASAGASIGLLAGGVLTQAINWHWIFFVNIPIGIVTAVLAMRLLDKDRGVGFGKGADILGAVLVTASLMLLVYTIVEPAADEGWGADPHARPRRRRDRAAGRVPRARGDGEQPADAAADLPLAQRGRRQRDPGPVRGRDVRHVLHGRALPADRARLQRARDRRRVPAVDDRDGHAVDPLLRAPGDALRRARHAAARTGAGRGRADAVHAGARRRLVRPPRAAGDGPARRGRRPGLPRADDAVDVGRLAERRRPRLRPRQHDAAGRRRDRPRRARHARLVGDRPACARAASRRWPRSTAATTWPT